MTWVTVFLFGLAVGSFLNVCIRRIPGGESIVRPASHCPACQTPIKPYDNIPVLSYLILRGRCRSCRARISPMYPLVELLTGLLFLICYGRFGPTWAGLKWALFSALLTVLIATDLRERLLPDAVNFTGLGLGIVLSFFAPPGDGSAEWLAKRLFAFPPPEPALSLADAALGALVGSGLLWLVAEGYFRLRGREGMGLGDVKMMAMAGSFLGIQRTFLTILGGSVLGSFLGTIIVAYLFLFSAWRRKVAMRAHRKGLGSVRRLRLVLAKRYQLPFGTYLGVAALAVVFFGTPALEWYQSLWAIK